MLGLPTGIRFGDIEGFLIAPIDLLILRMRVMSRVCTLSREGRSGSKKYQSGFPVAENKREEINRAIGGRILMQVNPSFSLRVHNSRKEDSGQGVESYRNFSI